MVVGLHLSNSPDGRVGFRRTAIHSASMSVSRFGAFVIRHASARVVLAIALLLSLPLAGSAQRGGHFSSQEMKAWLTYIASDELQGRQVFTEGLGLAAAYIADHLKEWDVSPAGDEGTYYQTVKVLGMRTRSKSSVTVTAHGETRTFVDGQGVTFARSQGGKQTISGRLEFVGYGLRFTPLEHDDYAGRELKGKVALFVGRRAPGMTAAHDRLVNARARFAIETMQALAAIGPTAAAQNAGGRGAAPPAAQGAAPPTAQGAAPPATQGAAANAANNQRVDFQTAQRVDMPVPPQITAGDEFYDFVFTGTGHRYADLKDLASRQEALPRIDLKDATITIAVDAEYDLVQTRLTRNVVGLVRGTDSRLRDTYVVLGAHYDHVGYQQFAGTTAAGPTAIASCPGQTRPQPRAGDIINNGADDDGSGTVSLMAIARAFATGSKPKRSVLFVWHAGEEGGLVGSRYMADHPVVPVERMAAQLNIDMVGRNRCDDPGQANTVYLVGSDRISTELHNVNEEANASLRAPLTLDYELNDASDLESIYTRSDHYSYAAKGVPVIFFTTGLHRDYHFVTDEVDRIEFGKMARIAELVYATTARVANLDHLPARDNQGARVGKGQSGKIRPQASGLRNQGEIR